jgi:DNA-binding CsgD family transcriptional regulator
VLKADPEQARPPLRVAVAAGRRAGGPALLSEALSMASIAANMAGDTVEAGRLLEEAQAAVTGVNYPPGTISVLQTRALNGLFAGDLRTVRSAAAQGVRVASEESDLYSLEMMQLNLGSAALLTGDLAESRPLLQEALKLARLIDDRVGQFYLLGAIGCHAALSGHPIRAAQLLGAADTARAEAGANIMPFFAPLYTKARKSAVMALGSTRFAAEFEAGRRLGRDRAIGFALGEPIHAAASASPEAEPGMLAKREAEVARLVADGLSNKQIGTRLFISERTVDSHVRSILNKLGFSSRAQIAGWIAASNR